MTCAKAKTPSVDAADAALAVARRCGVAVDSAEIVSSGTHVLVKLEPGPIAARVTADGLFAPFAGDLDVEVRVAAALAAAGAPVIPPFPRVEPRAHLHGGRQVTLWTWWENGHEDESPQAAGKALAACHSALGALMPDSLAPWVKLTKARERLGDLPASERAILAPHLQPPAGPLRPIHGDAHAGNVMPGPVWHDWEDAQLGCIEWDLACLVGPGRVVGMDFGHGEAVLAGYDLPYDVARLERCVAARTAQQAVYGLLLGDAVPGLAERVAVRLDWLGGRDDPASRSSRSPANRAANAEQIDRDGRIGY